MKRKVMLIGFCLTLLAMGLPQDVGAQGHGRVIKMEIKEERLTDALKHLEKVSGYKILFSYDDMKRFKVSNKVIKTNNIRHALNVLIASNPIEYQIDGQYINVFLKEMVSRTGVAQQRTQQADREVEYSGRVVDATHQPVIGATVLVKGTGKGVSTDENGHFSIAMPKGQQIVLQFSYVGMKTTTRTLSGSQDERGMTIVMAESATLSEVVVNGIYTRKAESFTGSATTVTGNDLRRVTNQNVLQSLKNLDPTVYIADNLSAGSDPNSTPTMSMRGTSSFPTETTSLKSTYQNQPNEPLFILDGFETTAERVKDLDMNRVESVTILKDASAKALYGSKAANGVVVIETKRLAGTEARITYNGSLDLEMPDLSSYDMTNALEKLQVEKNEGIYDVNSAYYGGSGSATQQQELTALYNQRYKLALEGLNTNWMAKPLRTGVGQKHNINIELGDARNLRGVLNFTYNDVAGVMKGSNRRNISGDVSLSYRRKNLLFKNILSVISNHSSDSPYGLFSDYVKMNPYWQAVDSKGNVLRWAEVSNGNVSSGANAIANPLYDATIGTSLKSTYQQFTNNFYAEWTIIPDLKLPYVSEPQRSATMWMSIIPPTTLVLLPIPRELHCGTAVVSM